MLSVEIPRLLKQWLESGTITEEQYRHAHNRWKTDVNSAAASPAKEQAFNMPALLGMILLNLPRTDILSARLICRFFNSTIEASHHIRRRYARTIGEYTKQLMISPGTWMNWVMVRSDQLRGQQEIKFKFDSGSLVTLSGSFKKAQESKSHGPFVSDFMDHYNFANPNPNSLETHHDCQCRGLRVESNLL